MTRPIEEIRSILETYSGGPIVITAAKDLLTLYDELEKKLKKLEQEKINQK